MARQKFLGGDEKFVVCSPLRSICENRIPFDLRQILAKKTRAMHVRDKDFAKVRHLHHHPLVGLDLKRL